MRANFQPSLAFTLGFERGKVDHPKDPGGRTNRGITQRTYDAHRDSKGQQRLDVYLIGPAEVEAIYLNRYWMAGLGASSSPNGRS